MMKEIGPSQPKGPITPPNKNSIANTNFNKNKIDSIIKRLNDKTLNRNEAENIQKVIEVKKKEAFKSGDIALTIGLGLLAGAIIAYLAYSYDKDKKNK
jgi:hypothetical protein